MFTLELPWPGLVDARVQEGDEVGGHEYFPQVPAVAACL